MRYMVISDSHSGCFCYGPFPSEYHAKEWANRNLSGDFKLAQYFQV